MISKQTQTTEKFILPEEFDLYNSLGYVIFMSKPTAFGTYRAIKIELVPSAEPLQWEKKMQPFASAGRSANPFTRAKMRLSPFFQ